MRRILTLLLLTLTAPLHAQFSSAPILTAPPNIPYPPIARAAHVSGTVVVSFAIDHDGNVVTPQVVSGPEMLRYTVMNSLTHWRFKTPLPLNAETAFQATYTFNLTPDADPEDDLDAPVSVPCCGDVITVKSSDTQITAEVHSLSGSQTIDVHPGPAAAAPDRCPTDKQKTPPTETDLADYVELRRNSCAHGCPDYRVRVTRGGQVSWFGRDGVATLGPREALIDATTAQSLIALFQTPTFWSACAVPTPPEITPKPPAKNRATAKDAEDDDNPEAELQGVFLTVGIHSATKSINALQYSLPDSDIGEKLLWAVDRAANTHRWRHSDPALEPFTNMREDLLTPKPGVTALIRSTYQFSPYTAVQKFTHLEALLANNADLEATDASGWTALMYSSFLNPETDLPQHLLLVAHANPNRVSLHGDTALIMAAYSGYLSQPLLDAHADINARNADGLTTLMLLAQHPDPDVIQAALAAGANPNAKDIQGRTALDYLQAAACNKPFIPLPQPYMFVVNQAPKPCPSQDPNVQASQHLLQHAMEITHTQF